MRWAVRKSGSRIAEFASSEALRPESRAKAKGLAGAAAAPIRRTQLRASELTVSYAEDPDGSALAVQRVLEEYERFVEEDHSICRGCPVQRSGAFIAYSMLDWKATYGDGRLVHWTRRDVAEYLLDHFPRKVSMKRRELEDVPSCVRDLFYFLSDAGLLAGEPIEKLKDVADDLYEQFVAAASDRRNWGMAKSFFSAPLAAVPEPPDLDATHAATRGDGGLGAMPPKSAGRRRSSGAARRAKRKAVRAARRRNRR